jgi:urate oxidase
MGAVLGTHQYGKAEIRLVHVDRETDRHVLRDLNVSTVLRGDFSAAHLRGDNSTIVATDTQKNTAYALARQYGIGQLERFAERLGRHFLDEFSWVTGARIQIDEYPWSRIPSAGGGDGHDHAFVRGSDEKRQTTVTLDGADGEVVSGLRDLVVLKTTASEFAGFPRDRFWRPRSMPAGDMGASRRFPTSISIRVTCGSGMRCSRCSPTSTASRCSKRSSRWGGRQSRRAPTSRR